MRLRLRETKAKNPASSKSGASKGRNGCSLGAIRSFREDAQHKTNHDTYEITNISDHYCVERNRPGPDACRRNIRHDRSHYWSNRNSKPDHRADEPTEYEPVDRHQPDDDWHQAIPANSEQSQARPVNAGASESGGAWKREPRGSLRGSHNANKASICGRRFLLPQFFLRPVWPQLLIRGADFPVVNGRPNELQSAPL